MAIEKKLVHFKRLDSFLREQGAGNILDTSIVFIQDANLIWTHGRFYGGVGNEYVPTEYPEIENNEEIVFNAVQPYDSVEDVVEKLEGNIITLIKELGDVEEVIATAITELKETKADLTDVEELASSINETVEPSLEEIRKTHEESEYVISKALYDLNERKADKDEINTLLEEISVSTEIGSDYVSPISETDAEYGLVPVFSGESLETAVGKIENNLNNLATNLVEIEEVTAASYVDLDRRIIENEKIVAATLTDLETRKIDFDDAVDLFAEKADSLAGYGIDHVNSSDVILDYTREGVETSLISGHTLNEVLRDLEDFITEVGGSVNEESLAVILKNYLKAEDATGDIVTISENYQQSTYPETEDEDLFSQVNPGDTLDTAVETLEKNIAALVGEIISNEKTVSSALNDLEARKMNLEDATGKNIIISNSYQSSSYPDNTGDAVFNQVNPGDTLDTAIETLEQNLATLVDETISIEKIVAGSIVDLNDKKVNVSDLSDQYSDVPQLQYKSFGGYNVYEMCFKGEYRVWNTETTWTFPCTTDTNSTLLRLDCFIKKTDSEGNTISFDYRDLRNFNEGTDISVHYNHTTGSLVITFISDGTSEVSGVITFACDSAVGSETQSEE